jgi:GNAT superfamily N-acetyltransferase
VAANVIKPTGKQLAARERGGQVIRRYSPERDAALMRQMLTEYLQIYKGLEETYGFTLDLESELERMLQELETYPSRAGRVFLADRAGQTAGMGCLKPLTSEIIEIKRMFVRGAFRRQGVGKEILDALVEAAQELGFKAIRLDSLMALVPAHQLYLTNGFERIGPYEGSEGANFNREWFVYMERKL